MYHSVNITALPRCYMLCVIVFHEICFVCVYIASLPVRANAACKYQSCMLCGIKWQFYFLARQTFCISHTHTRVTWCPCQSTESRTGLMLLMTPFSISFHSGCEHHAHANTRQTETPESPHKTNIISRDKNAYETTLRSTKTRFELVEFYLSGPSNKV